MSLQIPRLDDDPDAAFPHPRHALTAPDGLLAWGGDLSPTRLLNAYRLGIFPWYSGDQPILWWSPDPRMVFPTGAVRLSSRFRRRLRSSPWIARADSAFGQVIERCATAPRAGQRGTWITADMHAAYLHLHTLGHAHSIEVFAGPEPGAAMVGGLYGVAIGRMFFGESMFSGAPGGSKVALASLAAWLQARGWPWIDAQVETAHLASLGGTRVPRERFVGTLQRLVEAPGDPGPWTEHFGMRPVHLLGRS